MNSRKLALAVAAIVSLLILGLLVPIKSKTLDIYCQEMPRAKSFHLIRGQYMGYADAQESLGPPNATCTGEPVTFRLYLL